VSCSSPVFPTPDIIERAIELQLQETEAQLSQNLGLSQPLTWQIDRIDIRDRQWIPIENLPGFQLSGNYILTARSASQRLYRRRYSFQIYLQRQKEGKTWRLARPVGTERDRRWLTELVPPPDWIP